MKLEWAQRSCPLCGSTDGPVFAESNINVDQLDQFAFASRKLPEYMHPRLVECSGCGLLYANPTLSVSTLEDAYAEAAFDSGEEAQYAAAAYAAQVRMLVPGRGAALDIGTGDGAFLEQLLGMGFNDVIGVEPSHAPVAAAKPDIRLRIRQGLFNPEDFTPHSFSLVTCFQTMEHVADPLGIARAVHGLLDVGGAFVMVVHNRRAVSAKILGMKSPIFDVEHLQLFCPVTARQLLERAGYERVQVSVLWNTYPLRYWLRLFPAPASFKRVLMGFGRSAVGTMRLSIPAGNLICTGYAPRG